LPTVFVNFTPSHHMPFECIALKPCCLSAAANPFCDHSRAALAFAHAQKIACMSLDRTRSPGLSATHSPMKRPHGSLSRR